MKNHQTHIENIIKHQQNNFAGQTLDYIIHRVYAHPQRPTIVTRLRVKLASRHLMWRECSKDKWLPPLNPTDEV